MSREMLVRGADAVRWRKAIFGGVIASGQRTPRGRRSWHVRNLSAREPGEPGPPARWSAGGPPRERRGGTPGMHGRGQSDRLVVPANPLNKAAAAEAGEGRKRTAGNTVGYMLRTQCRGKHVK